MNYEDVFEAPAAQFAVCRDLAARLRDCVDNAREGAPDEEARLMLKPAEELLCYYEVDPGNVSKAELQDAYETWADFETTE